MTSNVLHIRFAARKQLSPAQTNRTYYMIHDMNRHIHPAGLTTAPAFLLFLVVNLQPQGSKTSQNLRFGAFNEVETSFARLISNGFQAKFAFHCSEILIISQTQP